MEQDSYRRLKILKAEEKVKKIKGLYFHLFIYLIVNLVWVIALLVIGEMSSYTRYGFWGMGYGQLSMAFFWGIGLLIHWLLVSIKNISISKNWEERKIKELLEKDKQRWE